jgi:hypothetical protein
MVVRVGPSRRVLVVARVVERVLVERVVVERVRFRTQRCPQVDVGPGGTVATVAES